MKKRLPTQTWGKSKSGLDYAVSTLFLPIGGSIEALHDSLIIRTLNIETEVSLSNVESFRRFEVPAFHNYRIISKIGDYYRAVDFRCHNTEFSEAFGRMGFLISIITDRSKISYDDDDRNDYGIQFDLG